MNRETFWIFAVLLIPFMALAFLVGKDSAFRFDITDAKLEKQIAILEAKVAVLLAERKKGE